MTEKVRGGDTSLPTFWLSFPANSFLICCSHPRVGNSIFVVVCRSHLALYNVYISLRFLSNNVDQWIDSRLGRDKGNWFIIHPPTDQDPILGATVLNGSSWFWKLFDRCQSMASSFCPKKKTLEEHGVYISLLSPHLQLLLFPQIKVHKKPFSF